MSAALPQAIENAIDALSSLPGIGSRSAERLVFTLLRNEGNLEKKIAESLSGLRESIDECSDCHHYCAAGSIPVKCPVCANLNRDSKIICVVESPVDLVAVERTGEYRGLYHVLHGILSPLSKVGPDQIRAQSLIDRVKQNEAIEEVVFALAGNVESEATAHYLSQQLEPHFKGKIAILARGIPTGGDLDYLDAGTLSRAILDRREF